MAGASTMRLFIVAGESSGDLLGADLVSQLKKQTDLEVSGVGGDNLTAEGLQSMFPMSDLSVMGWRDVYMRLPKLLWRLKQTVDAIVEQKPDLVVLIDSQEFSNRVAQKVRERWAEAKIVLYVAPSVWAWRPERAQKIKNLYDEVLCVLPFEPRVFAELDGPRTSYVGHIAEHLADQRQAEAARKSFLLLPGSREGEINRNLKEITPTIDWLETSHDDIELVLPTLFRLENAVSKSVSQHQVKVVAGRKEFIRQISTAGAAIAVSGTVTLELGCANIPHVMTYLAEPKMMRIYEENGRPLINLNNIIVGRKFVPEVLGTRDLAPAILRETQQLLNHNQAQRDQLAGFEEMRLKMKEGEPEAPRQNAVDRTLELA